MKLIITESKRNILAIKMLEDMHPELKKITFPGHEPIFVSNKGMFKMSYTNRTKSLEVLDEMWDFIRDMFAYNDDEVSELFLHWANDTLGFRANKCIRVNKI